MRVLGLKSKEDPVYYNEYLTPPFAGFELNYQIIDFEIKDTLALSNNCLCNAKDFDKALEEKTELKAAGINDMLLK